MRCTGNAAAGQPAPGLALLSGLRRHHLPAGARVNTRVSAAAIVMNRDGGRCTICGRVGTDGHHRDLVGEGGSTADDRDAFERIVLVCRIHHGDIHRNPRAARSIGYYLNEEDARFGWENIPVWSPVDVCWYLLSRANTRLAYPNWLAPTWDLSWITPTPAAERGYERKPTR